MEYGLDYLLVVELHSFSGQQLCLQGSKTVHTMNEFMQRLIKSMYQFMKL